MRRLVLWWGIGCLLMGGAWCGGFFANGEEFIVTQSEDFGAGTLRAAILRANLDPGADTIRLNVEGVMVLTTSLPRVTGDLTIEGPGWTRLRLSGGGRVPVLSFGPGTTCRLSGVTVSDGVARGGISGAGLANAGLLTLEGCAVIGNRTEGGWGGGIYNAGEIRIRNSVVSSNTVVGGTGGTGAVAGGGGGGGGLGGGLFSGDGIAVISDTIFEGNLAQGGVGGRMGTVGNPGGVGGGPSGAAGGDETDSRGRPGGLGGGGGGGAGARSQPPLDTDGEGGLGGLGGGGGGGGLAKFPYNLGGGSVFGGGRGSTGANVPGTGGFGAGGGGAGIGGGVFVNGGRTTIERCQFAHNRGLGGKGGESVTGAQGGGGFGGAVFANEGEIVMRDCVVAENSVQGEISGGGYAGGDGGPAGGGGVVFRKSVGTLVGSTLVSNKVLAGASTAGSRGFSTTVERGTGGAIGQWGGVVALTNCTVAGNVAQGGRGPTDGFYGKQGGPGLGGGYYGSAGSCRMVHCTFTGNRAEGGQPGFSDSSVGAPTASPGEAHGGGFWVGSEATNTIANSLFFGNALTGDRVASDGFGSVVSVGRNLVGTATNVLGLTSLDRIGADPRLGRLDYRGGPTPTLPLGKGSAAIDAAALEWAPEVDQRGFPRPDGAGPDIGSIEESSERPLSVALFVDDISVAGPAVTNLGPARIRLASNRATAVILYTLDGSVPDPESTQYDGPLTLARDTRVRFFAYESDFSARTEIVTVDLTVAADSRVSLVSHVAGSGHLRIVPEPGPYAPGTVVRLTALAADGWRFSGWSGDASGQSESYELRLDGNRSVMAEFVPVATFPLSIGMQVRGQPPSANYPRGVIELGPPGGGYVSNTLVSVRARVLRTPLVQGSFGFGRWYGDASGRNPEVVVRMDRPRSVTAEFDYVPWSLLGCWLNLETIGGGEAVETVPRGGGDFYLGGGSAVLVARAAEGWTFMQWTGDYSGGAAMASLPMLRDAHVVAVFGTSLRRVTAGSGTIEVTPDRSLYPGDSVVRLRAVPGAGHRFVRWGGALSGKENPTDLVVRRAEPTVSALFVPLSEGHFSLVPRVEGEGDVLVEPASSEYAAGSVIGLAAVPGVGQEFLGWAGDILGNDSNLTVTVDRHFSVVAKFTRRPRIGWAHSFDYPAMESYRLRLWGAEDGLYAIEGSADLRLWTRQGALRSVGGWVQFPPIGSGQVERGFYRVVREGP